MTASVSAAIRGTNDHLAIGIGGTRQAVVSAAALRCLGGDLQAQLWPTSRREIDEARERGIEDVERIFSTEDLGPKRRSWPPPGSRTATCSVVSAFTPTAPGRTPSSCAPGATGCVHRRIHFFPRERREEVRLPGF